MFRCSNGAFRLSSRSVNLLQFRSMCTVSPGAQTAVTNANPTFTRLKVFALSNAVPMIGFGAMDNFVMIQAGDLIDSSIGAAFGLATLTSAACGQIFSDVSGVAFGGVVDRVAGKLGLIKPDLTRAELELPLVRRVGLTSRICGVVMGCLLGMTSLLFMDLDKSNREKRAKELSTIFRTVVKEGRRLVKAEQCKLYLVDESDPAYIFTKAEKRKSPDVAVLREAFHRSDIDNNGKISCEELIRALDNLGYDLPDETVPALLKAAFPQCTSAKQIELDFDEFRDFMLTIVPVSEYRLRMGLLCQIVFETGKLMNIDDVYTHPKFDRRIDLYSGSKTRNILIGPVVSAHTGKIIGFIQVKNKKGGETFTKADEVFMEMLCSHVSGFIDTISGL